MGDNPYYIGVLIMKSLYFQKASIGRSVVDYDYLKGEIRLLGDDAIKCLTNPVLFVIASADYRYHYLLTHGYLNASI